MKKLFSFFFLLVSAPLFSQHGNVLINNGSNEPSIWVNPKNLNQVVAGSNINNFFYSGNGGLSWTASSLTSTYGVWGDPAIITDTNGDFYYFHLSNPTSPGAPGWIDRIICQKSTNGGATWSTGTFMGKNGLKAQDKHWPVNNPYNNDIYVTWTQFDKYGSILGTDSSNILFSKSTDAGATWTSPIRINKVAGDCIDEDNTTEGAVPAVGPNGEIYVSWAGPSRINF
jgi:hypothetical protein